jgi:hypothetical protein
MPGEQRVVVNSLNLGLPQQPQAKGSLHKWTRVDLVIRLRDGWQARLSASDFCEPEAVAGGAVSGVVNTQTFDGPYDALGIGAILCRVRRVECACRYELSRSKPKNGERTRTAKNSGICSRRNQNPRNAP